MNRVLAALVAIVAIVGMAVYGRTSDRDLVQARLTQLCAGDAGCQQAVHQHYEACFDSAYDLRVRRHASLDETALVACLNSRAGEDYFTVEEGKKRQ
jgi:hypothetical protein